MTDSSWSEGREALEAIFAALARRLGARAEVARRPSPARGADVVLQAIA